MKAALKDKKSPKRRSIFPRSFSLRAPKRSPEKGPTPRKTSTDDETKHDTLELDEAEARKAFLLQRLAGPTPRGSSYSSQTACPFPPVAEEDEDDVRREELGGMRRQTRSFSASRSVRGLTRSKSFATFLRKKVRCAAGAFLVV